MIFPSNASSEWFRIRVGKARLLGLAVLFAGLGGCAISMPIPGLMDKEPTGSIAAKSAAKSTDPVAGGSVTSAAMRAEAPLPPAPAKPAAADN